MILKVFLPLSFINSTQVFFTSVLHVPLGSLREKRSLMQVKSFSALHMSCEVNLYSQAAEAPYNPCYSTYPRLAFIIPFFLGSLQSPNLKRPFCLSYVPSIACWGLQNATHLQTIQVKTICVWTIVF